MLIKGCILKTMSMSEMKIPFCDMEYHGYCNWAWALIFDGSKVAQLKRKSTKTRKGHTSSHRLTINAPFSIHQWKSMFSGQTQTPKIRVQRVSFFFWQRTLSTSMQSRTFFFDKRRTLSSYMQRLVKSGERA